MHQGGRFYRLSTGRAAHCENIKPHNASSEDWCIPADIKEGDYLILDSACEVNERGTRDKNDGNGVVDNCDLPLDLELTERVEMDDETLPYAEEDWDCPEQTENDKGVQTDFPLTMETRQSKKEKNKKKYNPYGEDFVIDRIVLSEMMESLVGLDEVAVPREIDLVNDMDQDWIDDHSDFILTERTCAIAITADVGFKTALAADFKREFKNIEFLWKQRPGVGGMIALPPVASEIPGKYLCLPVTKATAKQDVDLESLVLALTRLRDFLVERGVTSLSLPVYDPKRGKKHPRELYALVHVIFSETDIEVYLHKKYYLSIC